MINSDTFTFTQYESVAKTTATYESADYLPLGLSEEVGELIHEFARCKRKGVEMDVPALISEVGDVLWVLSQIAREYDFTLSQAARSNLGKLQDRNEKGAIHDKTNR